MDNPNDPNNPNNDQNDPYQPNTGESHQSANQSQPGRQAEDPWNQGDPYQGQWPPPGQQSPEQQSPHYYQDSPTGPEPPGKGQATASLVLGIVALVFCWFPIVNIISIICGVIGIFLSVGARKKNAAVDAGPGLATGGLICNIVALVIALVIFTIGCVGCVTLFRSGVIDEITNQIPWNELN
jgi:hypothetical protein